MFYLFPFRKSLTNGKTMFTHKFFKCFLILCFMKLSLAATAPEELYLDLMKKCLLNSIYAKSSESDYNQTRRENGLDWPQVAHTMIGMKRLNNLQYCAEEVLKNNIPGDFIETGVWRGGATIFMRAILKAYNDTTRKVWVADSFEGLPPPNPDLYPADKNLFLNIYPQLSISLEQVKANFEKYDLLDDQVVFLKGFFSKTLPKASIKEISLLRLDGDLYESTMDGLVNLYPKLSIGGYIIVDDYGVIPACAKAVHDYRIKNHIDEPIIKIDKCGVFWQKLQ